MFWDNFGDVTKHSLASLIGGCNICLYRHCFTSKVFTETQTKAMLTLCLPGMLHWSVWQSGKVGGQVLKVVVFV